MSEGNMIETIVLRTTVRIVEERKTNTLMHMMQQTHNSQLVITSNLVAFSSCRRMY